MVELVHVIRVDNSVDRVYNLLIDYDLYPEIMPEIKGVNVLSQRRISDTVEFTGRMIKWVRSTLRLRKFENREINWRQLEGDFLLNRGSWKLRPVGEAATEVKFILKADIGASVPRFIVRKALELSIPRMLHRFRREAELVSY